MKKPDMLMLIAIWQLFFAIVIALLGFFLFAFSAMPDFSGAGKSWDDMDSGEQMALTVVILFVLCFLTLAVAGGVGLLMNKGHKWARIFSIVNSVLILIAVPIGTVIGTLSIIYLVRQDVRDFFNPPQK